jgi:putative polyhydroxyalkanoate system protein
MADIKVSQTYAFAHEECKKRVGEYIEKMGDSMGLKLSWKGDVCTFSGSAKGQLSILEDRVEIEVKLGLAARLFKGKIEKKIKDGLLKALT